MKLVVHITICENDRHGKRSGLAHRIDFSMPNVTEGHDFLMLVPNHMDGEPIRTDRILKIIDMYDCRIPFIVCNHWDGSIAFNKYVVQPQYALGFINLLKNKRWQIDQAWDDIADKWDKPGSHITWKELDLSQAVEPEIIDLTREQLKLFK